MGVGGQRHTPVVLPQGKGRDVHCTGGCVDPTFGMDGCEKSRHHRDSIPGPSRPANRYTDCAVPAHITV
jgi:hypothetical protein